MRARWWHLVRDGTGLPWWFPLPWLVYLLPLLFGPYYTHAPPSEWLLIALGILLTTALFLRGFWARGWESVAIVVALFALGCAYGPHNQNASVFFVYGAVFIGLRSSRTFWREIAGYAAAIGVAAAFLHFLLPVWAIGIMLSVVFAFAASRSVQHNRLYAELLRTRAEAEQFAKIAERERIARDLHDVLGQTLTLIAIKSELASKLAGTDPARATSEIRDVERIAREAMRDVRTTVTAYRNTGIAAEVESARALLEEAGLTVEINVASVPMEPRTESALALALREAATNVVRHARASHVTVVLQSDARAHRLEVRDDGVGGTSDDGNGLTGMRERVQACGGTVVRENAGGTQLAVTVPVGGEHA